MLIIDSHHFPKIMGPVNWQPRQLLKVRAIRLALEECISFDCVFPSSVHYHTPTIVPPKFYLSRVLYNSSVLISATSSRLVMLSRITDFLRDLPGMTTIQTTRPNTATPMAIIRM